VDAEREQDDGDLFFIVCGGFFCLSFWRCNYRFTPVLFFFTFLFLGASEARGKGSTALKASRKPTRQILLQF